jgi:hypothetical protein
MNVNVLKEITRPFDAFIAIGWLFLAYRIMTGNPSGSLLALFIIGFSMSVGAYYLRYKDVTDA